jgi:hypothetical protein
MHAFDLKQKIYFVKLYALSLGVVAEMAKVFLLKLKISHAKINIIIMIRNESIKNSIASIYCPQFT